MSDVRSRLVELSSEEKEHFLGEVPRLLLEGHRIKRLCRLLSDYDFIEAKINHPQFGVKALIEDYDLIDDIELLNYREYGYQTIKSLKLIHGALRLSAHILIQDTKQLAGQLSGRLLDFDTPEIKNLLQQISQTSTTCLRSLRASLSPPNGYLISTLIGHTDSVNAVAVTPDGQLIISGSSDNTIKVWDLNTGVEILTFTGHSSPVNAVAATPDGKRVISGASDNTVRVWDLATGKEIRKFNGHSEPVIALAVTPNGKKVVSASIAKKNSIKVWDLETEKEELTLEGHTNLVRTLVITSDNRVISGSENGAIKIWSLEDGKEISCLIGTSKVTSSSRKSRKKVTWKVYEIRVSVDGKLLLAGCKENYKGSNAIIVWNLETKKLINILHGHASRIVALSFTPDGKRFISASLDKTLKVWDTESKKKLLTLTGHHDSIYAVTMTPDGKNFISASKDTTLKIWNLDPEEKHIEAIDNSKSVSDIAFILNKKQAILSFILNKKQGVFSLEEHRIEIWNFENNKSFFKLITDKEQYFFARLKDTTFSQLLDVFWVLLPFFFGFNVTFKWIYIISNHTRTLIHQKYNLSSYFEHEPYLKILFFIFFLFVILGIIGITLMPANEKKDYLTNNEIDKIKKNGKYSNIEIRENFPKNRNIPIAYIPSKAWLIFSKNNLNICSLNDKKNNFYLLNYSQIFSVILYFVTPVANIFFLLIFSELFMNKYEYITELLAINSIISFIIILMAIGLWDYTTTILTAPDGKYLFSGSTDKTIKVWNLQTKKLIFVLKGHREEITHLALDINGKYLISASKDKTIKIWNLENRKEIFAFTGHGDSVNTISVTPDAKYLISGSDDKKIKIWNLETREEIFTFTGHTDSINAVNLTSNGQLVISASSDKTIQVWDFATRKLITQFTGESPIKCCAVAPDDVTIVAGEESGRIHFLRLQGIEVQS